MPSHAAGMFAGPGAMTSGDFLMLFKAWGAGIAAIAAVFFVGVFAYSVYWWCTSEDFREALMTNNPSGGERLPEHIVRAKMEQRKHKVAMSTPTELRQMIIKEAPNLVGASNRIPVGHRDELEEVRPCHPLFPRGFRELFC